MAARPRSLADSLRSFSDDRLTELFSARPDLATPVPKGISQLAARAAGTGSVHRALSSLTLPEFRLAEVLCALPDGTSLQAVASACGCTPTAVRGPLYRLATLALVWGDKNLTPVRSLRSILTTPAGLAPVHENDPDPSTTAALIARLDDRDRARVDQLAWESSRLRGDPSSPTASLLLRSGIARQDGDDLVIPRPVQLALRDGLVYPSLPVDPPAIPSGEGRNEVPESTIQALTAQAIDAAFETIRVVRQLTLFDDDPPSVLKRGGLASRDLKRLATRAETTSFAFATLLHTAWSAGLLGHNGQVWQLTRDYDEFAGHDSAERWSELATAWAGSHLVTGLVGTAEPAGRLMGQAPSKSAPQPRPALSDSLAPPGARTRRRILLRFLARGGCAVRVEPSVLTDVLSWSFPLVRRSLLEVETDSFCREASVLGLLAGGVLSPLGLALASHLGGTDVEAQRAAARTFTDLAPAPVEDILLQADLTGVIPGRPGRRVATVLNWSDTVSRGGAVTVRFSSSSIRRALEAGRDVDDLLDVLGSCAPTGIPQALEYLIADECRRVGQVKVGRASTFITGDTQILDLLLARSEAAVLALARIAPTVAVTSSDPGFVMQVVRSCDLAPLAVGTAGRTVRLPSEHGLRGGPVETPRIERNNQPELQLPADEVVRRLRTADAHPDQTFTVTDRLLEAIAEGQPLHIGIVDGKGGIITRQAVPLSLDGGRLRARDVRGDDEFTVLVHRVTLG
ncbi:helicase-associated domain-containing protein [Devriesea agamarum]|uniref:helicase-associated domain-containing protein n=1 Tax=Devriesea agamarum TaxID=472569 RepID=UPI00071C7E5B|nr:helicase-associated domain-containing protein [Devriesea agamarum]